METPYSIPDTCPVSALTYGERAGYPAFWTQGDSVWAGLRTLYDGGSKVLWITDGPQVPQIDAKLLDQPQSSFQVHFSHALESPAWHPSLLTFSTHGCWRLDVTSGNEHVELVVYVFPNQYAYRLVGEQWVTITAVRFPASLDDQPTEQGEQFVLVELWIESAAVDREVLPWQLIGPLSLRDAEGNLYPLVAASGINGNLASDALRNLSLEPDEDVRVAAFFSIPESPLGMELILTGLDDELIEVPITQLTGE